MNEEQNVQDAPEMEFKVSPEAASVADAAIADMKSRSFSARNPELGKMFSCPVCDSRHRKNLKCGQKFKQMWVDEDIETGKLEIQYATVPLPGQNATPKSIVGAQYFAKKRKSPRPNHTGLQVVELTRKIFARINPERFPEEAGRMLEAKRIAVNTVRNKREAAAKKKRRQQRESRRTNRGK
jgi:hypothetical protein